MNQKTRKQKLFSKKIAFLSGRLLVALIAVGLGALLVMWDMGIVDLPFLIRKDRRDPITEEEKEEPDVITQEMVLVDWEGFARSNINALYDLSFLEDGFDRVTPDVFDGETMSLLKTRLPNKEYTTSMGFLIDPDGVIRFAKNLVALPDSESYSLTHWRDRNGSPIFQHKESMEYFVLDSKTSSWTPASFYHFTDDRGIDFAMPATYGMSESTYLIYQEGKYGYGGTYLDGRRKKELNIEPQYTTAFQYSEGIAVMADENGKITLRGNDGSEIFTELSLVLPEKKGMESLGFQYFDHGLLRVVFATYGEDGGLTQTREGVIDTSGKEFSIPDGFRVVSYYDGVFTLTDGALFGYYSFKGEWIASPVYYGARPFFEGLAVVQNEEGKEGLIDLKGNVVLPLAFDSVENFSEGVALVHSEGVGVFLLSKINGVYSHEYNGEKVPTTTVLYTKITLTRGPLNTFREDDEVIVDRPIKTTSSRPQLPEFWQ